MRRILILGLASAVGLLTQSAEAKVPGGPWRWLGVGWGDGYHAAPCPRHTAWPLAHRQGLQHPPGFSHPAATELPVGHIAPVYPPQPVFQPSAFQFPIPDTPEANWLPAPVVPPTDAVPIPPPPEMPWPDASARLPR